MSNTPQDISATFGEQLRQMRADLLAQVRAQRGGTVGRAQAAADAREQQTGDWVQDDAERDLAMALEEREADELNAIDSALQRIASGDYGLCAGCGCDIPTARLHANPVALRCFACQDQTEHAKGSSNHPSL